MTTLLDNMNASFDSRDMFTPGGEVDSGSSWKCLNQWPERCELTVSFNNDNTKAALHLEDMDCLVCLHDRIDLAMGQMRDSRVVNLLTQ
jgi:hypothetical protein